MQDIIERLERAAGPDRDLDGQIWIAAASQKRKDYIAAWKSPPQHPLDEYLRSAAPRYTASIDAALTLVPGDLQWDITGKRWGAFATIWDADHTCPPDRHQVRGETPAIALCIAALKARMALAGKEMEGLSR